MAELRQVLVEQENGIATVTLNRPDAGNAADPGMLAELADALGQLAADGELRALILRGAGDDFCRGRVPAENSGQPTALQVRQTLSGILAVNSALRHFPVPTLAAVEGRALGFGCGLAVGCDITIAGAGAQLGFPEMLRNLPPTIVMSYLGRLIPRKKALELVLTGRTVTPAEALMMGLINRVATDGQAYAEAAALARTIGERDPEAVRTCRRFFREAQAMDEEAAASYGINVLATILSSRGR